MKFDNKKFLEICLEILEKLKDKQVSKRSYTARNYSENNIFKTYCKHRRICWFASNEKNASIVSSIISIIILDDLSIIEEILYNYNEHEDEEVFISKIEFNTTNDYSYDYSIDNENIEDLKRIIKRSLVLNFDTEYYEKEDNLFSEFMEATPISANDVIKKLKIFIDKIMKRNSDPDDLWKTLELVYQNNLEKIKLNS